MSTTLYNQTWFTQTTEETREEEPFPLLVRFLLTVVQISLSLLGTILNGITVWLLRAPGTPLTGEMSANRCLLLLSICELGYCGCILGLSGYSITKKVQDLTAASGAEAVMVTPTTLSTLSTVTPQPPQINAAVLLWIRSLLFIGLTAFGAGRNWWLAVLTCVRAVAVARPHLFSVFMTRRVLDRCFAACMLSALLLGVLRFVFQFARLHFDGLPVTESQLNVFNFVQRVLRSALSCAVILLGSVLIFFYLVGKPGNSSSDKQTTDQNGANSSAGLQRQKSAATRTGQRRRRQATVVVFVLAISFCLLETPTVVVSYSWPDSKWHDVTNLLLILNACVNFFIFLATKKDFRAGLKHLCRHCACASRRHRLEGVNDEETADFLRRTKVVPEVEELQEQQRLQKNGATLEESFRS